jgi:hypothetical protein
LAVARLRTRSYPKPGQLWISCPPYLLVARITGIDARTSPSVVSYELYDENGFPIECANATLDEGWWRAFQPLVRHQG